MKQQAISGAVRQQFTDFANTFNELSPEGRRSLMVASVISFLSLGLIGAASIYTWRSPEPIADAPAAADQAVTEYTVPPINPTATQLHNAEAGARPVVHKVVAASPAAGQAVKLIPIAAVQPVAARPVASVAPAASSSPVAVTPAVQPSAEPVLKETRLSWRHRQGQQLSQAYIRAYLARQFPQARHRRTRAVEQQPDQGQTLAAAIVAPSAEEQALAAKHHRRHHGRRGQQDAAVPQPLTEEFVRSYLARHGAAQSPAPVAAQPVAYTPTHRTGGGNYAIQIGYYSNRAFARMYAVQLAQQGLHSYMVSTRANGPVRLMVGRFDNVTDAQSAFRQMPAALSEGMIVKTNW